MPELTDEEIASRVQKGDTEAFGVLVERYGPKLVRYARTFLFGTQDAEDLVQDTFIKAYSNINSFDATRKFSSWIYRIAHNEFVNALKKRARRPIVSIDTDAFLPQLVSPGAPEKDYDEHLLREGLRDSLGQLAPKYREILALFYFDELDYKEIADILHIPISTVGVRIHRAKAALKKTIPTPPV
jgi:RNA polymerase sigma-70 factor (ECF subfamily)